jgi:hypothetical protein
MENRRSSLLKESIHRFISEMYDENQFSPSSSTIARAIYTFGYTRKHWQRIHHLKDPAQQLSFLRRLSFVDPTLLVDIDETASSPQSFLEKYGYSIEGEPAIRTQFIIGSRHFTVVAAYTLHGFLCWEIIEGSYNTETFVNFLNNILQRFILDMKFAIIVVSITQMNH